MNKSFKYYAVIHVVITVKKKIKINNENKKKRKKLLINGKVQGNEIP